MSIPLTGIGDDRRKWVVLGLLFFAAALNYADRTAITAVFPLLKRDLGMSDVALGATGSVFLWSYAISSPFAGYLGDLVSRARLLTITLVLWSLVMLLSGFAASTSQLLVFRGLLGLAEATYIPAATALIADYHDSATRGKAIGIHLAGFSFGMIGGGWLAGRLGEIYGWRPSFFFLGVGGLVLALVCSFLLRDARRPDTPDRPALPRASILTNIAELVRVPSFLILTADIVFSGTANWVFISWLPLYFKETFALSLGMAGLYGTLWIQGGRVMGVVFGGVPSDLAARRNPRYRMLIMSVCYFAAAPILFTFTATRAFAPIAAAITIYNFLAGMGYVNSQPLLCELLPQRLRSTAVGLMNMAGCFAGGCGVLLAGLLKSDYGLAKSFASLAAVVFGIACVLAIAYFTVLPRDLARNRL